LLLLDTSGPNNGYGTPLTDALMKQKGSFADWDFINIWFMCERIDYPKLRYFLGSDFQIVHLQSPMLAQTKWFIAD